MNCCLQDDVRSLRNDVLAQIGLLKDEVLQMRESSLPKFSTDIQGHLQPVRYKGGYQEYSPQPFRYEGGYQEYSPQPFRYKGGYQEYSPQPFRYEGGYQEYSPQPFRYKGGYQEYSGYYRKDVAEEERKNIRDKRGDQEYSGYYRKDVTEEGGKDVKDKGEYQEYSAYYRIDVAEKGGEKVRPKGGYMAEEGQEDVIEEEQPSLLPKYKVGWLCDQCTFYNTPYRPGCEMCGSTRPNSYIPPPDIIPTVDERMILEKDKEAEEQVVQVRNVLNILNSETLFAINLSILTVS